MSVITGSLTLSTGGQTDIVDLTARVRRLVADSGLHAGTVTVFSPSSTSGLTTVEFEPGAVADLKQLFENLVPSAGEYKHNETWGDGNGFSHMRAALLGASLTIPFVDKKLTLGTWQQIIYVDFDNRPRQRELVVQMVGE
jgi:secondary thiamine-phosphate synthase enzyme